MKIIRFSLLFSFANFVVSAEIKVDPLVLIGQGLIRGEKANDGEYSKFLGIPYALVDAENPFGASLPHPGFGDEVFNATDGSIACPQDRLNEGILDCLRLNILVPNEANSKNPMPVLVFMHGGAFRVGNAGIYGGHNLVKENIILVAINYRLGVYGFMCLGIPSVPGNQGLKDQLTALSWIRSNIGAFGGNPHRVTIAGQSSGGGSVVYHLYAPQRKLFHKAIIQSGVPLAGGFFTNPEEDAALELAEYLGFNTTNTTQALAFLTYMSPHSLTAAASALNLLLRPCKEKYFKGIDRFVVNNPFSLSNQKKIKDTPILIGFTSNEYNSDVRLSKDNFLELLLLYFNLEEKDLERFAAVIRHFYIGDKPVSNKVVRQLENFNSDFIINYPIERTIIRFLEEDAGPIYEYIFNYVSENDNGEKDNAVHTAELKYLFASNYADFNDKEKLMSHRMTNLWTNFVKYGNPTPVATDLVPVHWKPVCKSTRPYLMIDTNLRMQHRFRAQSMAFWDLFYSKFEQYSIFNS